MENLRFKSLVLHGVINILNRVLNSFEHFECYTKSIIYLLMFLTKMPFYKDCNNSQLTKFPAEDFKFNSSAYLYIMEKK